MLPGGGGTADRSADADPALRAQIMPLFKAGVQVPECASIGARTDESYTALWSLQYAFVSSTRSPS